MNYSQLKLSRSCQAVKQAFKETAWRAALAPERTSVHKTEDRLSTKTSGDKPTVAAEAVGRMILGLFLIHA